MRGKITLADLARKVGCSESQASRALSGKPDVAPELRARVKDEARSLNYRNLARNHQLRIALLTGGFNGLFTMELLAALSEESMRLRYHCMALDNRHLGIINEYFFDGVIAIGYNDNIAKHWGALSSLPLVLVNGYGLALENICSIDPDPRDGNLLALRHFVELGHRRIARVCGVSEGRSERGRHRGGDEFRKAAAQLGMTEAENVEFPMGTPLDEVIPPLLDRGITAILMIHQHLAAAAADCIHRSGRVIPRDVSLITYGVRWVSEFLNPPHTTLDFNYAELARRAFAELKLRIDDRERSPDNTINVPNILHIRASTAKFQKPAKE